MVSFWMVCFLAIAGSSLRSNLSVGEQVRRDGQEVTAGELDDLAGVPEARPHDLGLVVEVLEVIVDGGHRDHARVFLGRVAVAARRLLEPVEDATDERRDERDLGLGAGDGLVETEEEREVAVNALLLEDLGGADALPRRRELDEDPLPPDAQLLVLAHEEPRLGDARVGVERESGVHLGRDAAGNDLQDPRAELDGQPVDGKLHGIVAACPLSRLLTGPLEGGVDDVGVLGLLGRRGDEGGVGRRVLGLELLDGVQVARIGDDRGHLLQLVEDVLHTGECGAFGMPCQPKDSLTNLHPGHYSTRQR
jgi:hypothetical protein